MATPCSRQGARRADARCAGYGVGLAEGRSEMQAMAEQARTTQASVLQVLETAVAQACKTLETERPRLEHAAVELAFEIAKAVLARAAACRLAGARCCSPRSRRSS